MLSLPRLVGSRARTLFNFLGVLVLAYSSCAYAQGYPGGGPPAPSHYWQVTYTSVGTATMDYVLATSTTLSTPALLGPTPSAKLTVEAASAVSIPWMPRSPALSRRH